MATTGTSTLPPRDRRRPTSRCPTPPGRSGRWSSSAGPRGTLVAFVCNHCPYVKHVAVALRRRRRSAGRRGRRRRRRSTATTPSSIPTTVPSAWSSRREAWGWSFPYLVDADQTAALAYRAACTPDFFLFDAAGTLVYRGRFDGSTPGNNVPLTGDELDAAVARPASPASRSAPTSARASAAASSGSRATNPAGSHCLVCVSHRPLVSRATDANSRGEGGAEEGPQLVAQVAQGDDVGRPADGAERFGIGGDAGDGRRQRARRPAAGRRGGGGRRPSRRRGRRPPDRRAAAGGGAGARREPRAAGSARGPGRAATACARRRGTRR